jgi:hypothetical protein
MYKNKERTPFRNETHISKKETRSRLLGANVNFEENFPCINNPIRSGLVWTFPVIFSFFLFYFPPAVSFIGTVLRSFCVV